MYVLAGAATWARHIRSCETGSRARHKLCQFSNLRPPGQHAATQPALHTTQPSQFRQFCSHCLSRALQHTHQPSCSLSRQQDGLVLQQRFYHSLWTAPATTAADAPGLANLQGLLHVYKQSLDSVGRDAVEQLRHTLAPSDEEDLHEEDTGKHCTHVVIMALCTKLNLLLCLLPVHSLITAISLNTTSTSIHPVLRPFTVSSNHAAFQDSLHQIYLSQCKFDELLKACMHHANKIDAD